MIATPPSPRTVSSRCSEEVHGKRAEHEQKYTGLCLGQDVRRSAPSSSLSRRSKNKVCQRAGTRTTLRDRNVTQARGYTARRRRIARATPRNNARQRTRFVGSAAAHTMMHVTIKFMIMKVFAVCALLRRLTGPLLKTHDCDHMGM